MHHMEAHMMVPTSQLLQHASDAMVGSVLSEGDAIASACTRARHAPALFRSLGTWDGGGERGGGAGQTKKVHLSICSALQVYKQISCSPSFHSLRALYSLVDACVRQDSLLLHPNMFTTSRLLVSGGHNMAVLTRGVPKPSCSPNHVQLCFQACAKISLSNISRLAGILFWVAQSMTPLVKPSTRRPSTEYHDNAS